MSSRSKADPGVTLPIDRAALQTAFQDIRTQQAFERLFQQAFAIGPAALTALTEILANAQVLLTAADTNFAAGRVLEGGTGVTVDTAAPALATILVDVALALGYTPANQVDVAAIQAADGVYATAAHVPSEFANGRVLTGDTGLTIDLATANVLKLVLDALASLNALADVILTTPLSATHGAYVTSGLVCDAFEIMTTPTATVTASDHSVPIVCNGVLYYMRLSTTP